MDCGGFVKLCTAPPSKPGFLLCNLICARCLVHVLAPLTQGSFMAIHRSCRLYLHTRAVACLPVHIIVVMLPMHALWSLLARTLTTRLRRHSGGCKVMACSFLNPARFGAARQWGIDIDFASPVLVIIGSCIDFMQFETACMQVETDKELASFAGQPWSQYHCPTFNHHAHCAPTRQ